VAANVETVIHHFSQDDVTYQVKVIGKIMIDVQKHLVIDMVRSTSKVPILRAKCKCDITHLKHHSCSINIEDFFVQKKFPYGMYSEQ